MVRHGILAMLVLLGVHWSLAAQAPDVLHGRVVDAVTGVPVRNAVLSDLSTAVARTDADGRFELPRAEIRATLSITKSGYARHMLRPPASSGAIEVRLEKGAALTVYVINQSGTPVPDRRVNVNCKGSGRGGQADSAGRFRVAYLSEGACEVRFDNATPPMTRLDGPPTIEQLKARGEELRARALANAEAARTAQKTLIDLKAGDDVAYVAIDPSAAPPVPSMPPPRGPDGTSAIRGLILGADGEPLGGVLVRVAGQSTRTMRGATTSAAGEYEVAGLAADRYSVNATASGYEPGIYGQGAGGAGRRDVGGPGFVLGRIIDRGIDLTIEDGQRLDGIDMVLQKRGGISGTVTDEYGDPAEEVRSGSRRSATPP